MAVVIAVLAGLLVVGDPSAVAAADRAAVERAAERVLDGRFQGEPGERTKREGEPDTIDRQGGSSGGQRGGGGERRGGGGGGGGTAGGPGGPMGAVMSMLLWGALAVGAVFLIMFIIREIGRSRGDGGGKGDEDGVIQEPVPGQAELARPLEDAEALARDGRFAEAIHMLLLRTFQELVRASDVKISPSFTSREILARIPLLADGRVALTELVGAVELTWFGDDVPGEADWQRCRASFDRFVVAYRGAGRAREAA